LVTTRRDKWASDPFKPLRQNGFVYARGANDDKDSVTAGLTLVLLLHRNHVKLHRRHLLGGSRRGGRQQLRRRLPVMPLINFA
jgi:acetylornithine deacetylase/succinyl-diaminopimelate desuccinylase-like protein